MRGREFGWTLGAPARTLLLGAIGLYRATLSGWLGGQCRFHPSCSHYAEGAIRIHGAVKGTILATWRILRCNPFGRGGLDPVPPGGTRKRSYEVVIQHPTARAVGDPDAG
ncbi:MAG TPA: membrane protein insertion efficiency factor YidD [Actinomycetota bacterium]|nr:membrane protein insertion efficiency factor YidD [Actinomycetota bacterium]